MFPWLPLILVVTGCGNLRTNPSFPLSDSDARTALQQMSAAPKKLARPLVIVGGYHDPGIGARMVRWQLDSVIQDRRIISVDLMTAATFDDCRRAIMAAVDGEFPNSDRERTVEVDVIGISMGGLAARYAAMPRPGERSLKIARLFTISSPLRGAEMAVLPTWDVKQRQMRVGSKFYRQFEDARDAQAAAYQLVPYVRLHDKIVGPENAAPPGQTAWWVPDYCFELSHMAAPLDPRIIADIARRLREEEPFTREPRTSLPHI